MTLSYNILIELLRGKLGFNGLIRTDCMEMNVIISIFGTVEGLLIIIKVGSDIVLIFHSIEEAEKAINEVIKVVRKGEISEEKINESVMRILRLKEKRIGLSENGIKVSEFFSRDEEQVC